VEYPVRVRSNFYRIFEIGDIPSYFLSSPSCSNSGRAYLKCKTVGHFFCGKGYQCFNRDRYKLHSNSSSRTFRTCFFRDALSSDVCAPNGVIVRRCHNDSAIAATSISQLSPRDRPKYRKEEVRLSRRCVGFTGADPFPPALVTRLEACEATDFDLLDAIRDFRYVSIFSFLGKYRQGFQGLHSRCRYYPQRLIQLRSTVLTHRALLN
jgi:hypothetical protein